MSGLKEVIIGFGIIVILLLQMGSAQAAMVSNSEIVSQLDRTQVVGMLERENVQQQLTAMGVDPVAALARVDHMTGQEIAQLNGRLSKLDAGAGVGTIELLLIILLVIIIV